MEIWAIFAGALLIFTPGLQNLKKSNGSIEPVEATIIILHFAFHSLRLQMFNHARFKGKGFKKGKSEDSATLYEVVYL